MKYEKIKVNNCNIHLIKTNKFKTNTISINFREEIKKEDVTIRRFLFQMLCNSTKKYNTNRLLSIQLEDLYSTILSHNTVKTGNLTNSYIDLSFLNKKYTEEDLLPNIIDLIYEIILNPNVINNSFDKETFDTIKNKLHSSIISKKDDTAKYAIARSYELMDNNDPISYDLWGNLDDLELITPSNLYEYYKHVINENTIDIFIVGNINKNVINKFKKFNIGKEKNINHIIQYKTVSTPSGFIEDATIEQSKLIMICKALNITEYERKYVLPVYNSILGGSSSSRLFTNVREKNSLCYTIRSLLNASNSILTIYSGIDASNYEKTLKLVNKEISLKNITNEEISLAKMEIIAAIDAIFDSPGSIINYYFGLTVYKADEIDIKKDKFKNVTKKDLYELSEKIKLVFVYLLRGNHEE